MHELALIVSDNLLTICDRGRSTNSKKEFKNQEEKIVRNCMQEYKVSGVTQNEYQKRIDSFRIINKKNYSQGKPQQILEYNISVSEVDKPKDKTEIIAMLQALKLQSIQLLQNIDFQL
ncbi:unnamed protein product (macronuclear) [Paramecium tetraurelia]|uniref:Uncharacterized protein n=1 Tax=Paramecium tetraurelia TaxID=5888 RepID=A0BNT5_PARTE|nr:uncharacterized protein GSPATT00030841001 [Paramecium tetraurelia]CAK60202.1 unnamed protein product [Paramecium tetraurelia]|eukprot:XP_001427600.1 hypothetical protein (macronuclear) [Paramecium tetraurelia strain d4-2]